MASHCPKRELGPFLSHLILILISINPSHQFEYKEEHSSYRFLPQLNPRLSKAYIALQAWKHSIVSDPKNMTLNWCGPHVCNYTGVYCAPAPDNPHIYTVAGIDLNHGNIAGSLPQQLGLLTDLALFHINSNRFCGSVPTTFNGLKLLFELDVSNNDLSGPFPEVVLCLPSLKYLDIRFNNFHGAIPTRLFDLKLDALFINNNNFQFSLPENFGNSTASVIVFANNNLRGCFPSSVAKMKDTLNEIIITNSGITGCLPREIGLLERVTVFDVSFNKIVGELPESIEGMKKLEQLNVAHNMLSGIIPESVCNLPRLQNFTYSYNYFCDESPLCLKLPDSDDRKNCIPYRPLQRSLQECAAFYKHPVQCAAFGCSTTAPPPPAPPPPPPPPPPPDGYGAWLF
ncbi:leucine-rich repeat extensin-like protein 6 [Arachis ipaensis]|uniref:leucine-rich repeat extensin-like protein 6 n=1 Tax=Arachis ipaensis TaxID=130454 RepID=UPI000A2B2515|nr:leucine-rich repeat extensin-like protein 6 [Arachis ipaensis]